MRLLTIVAATTIGSAATAPASGAMSFPEIVREIRAADYRGARADLQRLAETLDSVKDPKLAAYRHYWRGFALWRRAINGFNETPTPADLRNDVTVALGHFRQALAEKPDWIEARIGMVGCWSNLLYLLRDDAPGREGILKEALPAMRAMRERGSDNPRALWLTGGSQLGAPPPYGGDAVKAAAIFHRGVEAALAEARRTSPAEPVWVPRWGGAENLMSLAYLYSHSAVANRDLALAYAEGALVAAPDWHYVRDILWPQILALPEYPAGR